jgi:integrase/recombinase XerD
MGKSTSKTPRTDHYSHSDRLAQKPNKMGYFSRSEKRPAKKRKSRKLPPYMTIPEKERFFKAIDSVRDRALFRLMYHHGLRASEIGQFQLSDYRQGSTMDLDRIYIHRLKGSISGECAVVPAAAMAVRAWLRKRGIKPGVLFPSRFGTAISRNRIYELMFKYCQRAQIPREKAHPHCLKHTCCTHLISDQRESIMDVRQHVGHVNIRSTMVYADLMPEATEQRAKRLKRWK